MAAPVNMSLDEIIQANKKNKRTGGMRSDGVKKAAGGPRVGGRPRNFAFSDHVPEGKWKHDMFNKVDNVGPRLGGNPNKRVTLNVSNLDPALIGPEDLEELFAPFDVEDIILHHDANGDRIGTAAVTCKKAEALKIIEEYKNVKLDGRLLKLAVVDDEHGSGSIRNRLEFATLSGRVTKPSQAARGGGFKRRGGAAGQNKPRKAFLDRIVDDDEEENQAGGGRRRGGGGRGGRERKAEKTEAELDAELDAYMNSGKSMEM